MKRDESLKLRNPGRVRNGLIALAIATFVMFMPRAALACAVCYGEPDSPATKGLTWAIVALALIVGMVLSGVVVFFVQANRKAAEAHDVFEGEGNS